MSQMTEQMARLIGNRLAAGEAVSLPEVGTLQVVFQGARRLTKRTVQPPCRRVEFSAEQQGSSLPELVEAVAVCDPATARSVYDRWLTQVREGDKLTIEGIGTLTHRHFAMTEAFDRRLNPHGHAVVQLRRKRRFDWVLVIGVVAILLAAGGLGVGYYLKQQQHPFVPQRVAVEKLPVETTEVSKVQDVPDAAEAAQPEAVIEPTTPSEPQPVEDYTRMQSGQHYVVMGVFTTPENAEHARSYFAGQQGGWNYRIYRFGSKYLLACHATATEEEARDFVRQHRTQFPDMWVYSAR